jgi:succinoglycan biosynthesis protein ExoL
MLILILSVFKIAWHRREFHNADLIVARNFDMLLLAQIGRLLALRPRLPLVYECLDIHGSFTQASASGRLFRAIERALLRVIQLLVVSSPGFIDNYFTPVQGYRGRVHLMENKVWFGETMPARPTSPALVAGGRPWVLGWVGSLRCEPSFRILLAAAAHFRDRLRITMHGNVHHHVVPDFETRISAHPNISYHGPYPYPQGLAAVYAGCDMVWAQDLWQAGANSDWLLPNRIYEASVFGCLSIAVSTTETGRKVARDRLGFTVPAATPEALIALIEALDPTAVEALRADLLARDPSQFIYARDDIRRMVADATGS